MPSNQGGPRIPLNEWTHICGRFSKDRVHELYINGVLDTSLPTTSGRVVGTPATDDAPLTEADVPPKPPRLKRNATDAEKAERAAIVEKRRRVKEHLRYQQRKAVAGPLCAVGLGNSYCTPPRCACGAVQCWCEWERLGAAAAARRAEAPATEERSLANGSSSSSSCCSS